MPITPEQSEIVKNNYSSWFVEKWKNPDIRDLYAKIGEYQDKYFSDLTLNDLPKWCDFDPQINTIISLLDYPWRYYVVPDEDADRMGSCALCHYDKETGNYYIKICESYKNNTLVILHEMIHALDYIIKDSKDVSDQLLPVYLYSKLYRKIPKLKHILFYNTKRNLFNVGHDCLFLLKSFDLDLRLKLPLGSMDANGIDDYIQHLNDQKN